jgi:hypothetical protein
MIATLSIRQLESCGHINSCYRTLLLRIEAALPPKSRFLSKITIDADTGCWNWNGAKSVNLRYPKHKYGHVKVGPTSSRVSRSAHAYAYELCFGPIADGFELDHTCQNKLCCNPLHLEAVTHAENCKRRAALSKETLSEIGRRRVAHRWGRK